MKEKDFLPLLKDKLGVEELNDMQKKILERSSDSKEIILLSPTGSGKTIAFILPVLKMLKPSNSQIQCVVIAPSRELVIQIGSVFRQLASGYRVVELYGGRNVKDESNSLSVTPDIIVATPGRLLDHSLRHNLELLPVRILVLDEFDKSLELGFEDEMKKLLKRMKNISRFILTSATRMEVLPEFLKLDSPLTIDFLEENEGLRKRQNILHVKSEGKDKLETLLGLLSQIQKNETPDKTIIFVNHRESAERIYEFLKKNKVSVALYHGGLEQRERETSIVLFNNGTRPILVATDLASRGLDIEKIKSIIHYHQPLTEEVYIHRNGRTARIDEEGDIYLLTGPEEELKEFITPDNEIGLHVEKRNNLNSGKETIFINAGKREKLSKGDILGFLCKECGLKPEDIGKIDVYDHYSLVALPRELIKNVLLISEKSKIKGERRKFSILK